jgi:hypothetical protein
MKESKMQTAFGKWLRKGEGSEVFPFPCAFELKLKERGKRLPFRAVADHQEEALMSAIGLGEGSPGVYYKLTDLSVGRKPFDCFWLTGARTGAFVIAGWWEKGAGVHTYAMDIRDYLDMKTAKQSGGVRSAAESDFSEESDYGGFRIATL